MNIPNVININRSKEIDASVFIDLGIDRILSNSDIIFLKHPCNEHEISNRQGIFRSMSDEVFCSTLRQCYDSINSYEKWKKITQTAHNELEKHCGNIRLLEEYVTICECFVKLHGYCDAVDKVAEYFMSEEKVCERNSIKASVLEMKDILLAISKCSISFVDNDHICKGYISSSYIDKLNRCATALKFEISSKKSTVIPFDDALADAVIQLYLDQFIRLRDIETSCKEQLQCAFFDIKAQISFIFGIWSLVQKAASVGIPYTFPYISTIKEIRINNAYSISLLSKNTEYFVPNNIRFDESIPFYFLTGANGGGKTEYLRALGTNLLLFLSGCPIFAESAWIYPFTYLSTHFPNDERYEQVGKLEDEKNRVSQMMDKADAESVLLFNETFSGTDQELGLSLLIKVAESLFENKIFGLAVTHLQGIDAEKYAVLCPEVIRVDDNDNKRTYRIIRKITTTNSYAKDIIFKYKLDQESLRKRKALFNG